jgi:hypothetical protein
VKTNIFGNAYLVAAIFFFSIVPPKAQSQSKEVKKEPVQTTLPNSEQ